MANTSLLAVGHTTASEARHKEFPVVFRGYDRISVDQWRTRTATTLATLERTVQEHETLEQELRGEVLRLEQRPDTPRRPSGSQPVAPGAQATRILAAAQGNADQIEEHAKRQAGQVMGNAQFQADQIIANARRESDQMVRHAQQQAGEMVEAARRQGAAERAQIIDGASAAARRQVAHYRDLASSMGVELRGSVERLLMQLAEWEQLAHEGAGQAAPVPA
jgi:DivIVA domain-containing protein